MVYEIRPCLYFPWLWLNRRSISKFRPFTLILSWHLDSDLWLKLNQFHWWNSKIPQCRYLHIVHKCILQYLINCHNWMAEIRVRWHWWLRLPQAIIKHFCHFCKKICQMKSFVIINIIIIIIYFYKISFYNQSPLFCFSRRVPDIVGFVGMAS